MTKLTKSRGFTIVELLIVIVIIAILAAITIAAYTGITARANNSASQSAATSLAKKIEVFNTENGFYPTTASSITVSGTDIDGAGAGTTTTDTTSTWYSAAGSAFATIASTGFGAGYASANTNKTVYYQGTTSGGCVWYRDWTVALGTASAWKGIVTGTPPVADCATVPAGTSTTVIAL